MGMAMARHTKKKQEQQKKKLEQQEKLISIAAIFLQGKNIEHIPQIHRLAFLKKKGLNDEMIGQAFKRLNEKRDKQTPLLPSFKVINQKQETIDLLLRYGQKKQVKC